MSAVKHLLTCAHVIDSKAECDCREEFELRESLAQKLRLMHNRVPSAEFEQGYEKARREDLGVLVGETVVVEE